MSKLFYLLCRLLLVIAVWGFALSLVLLALRLPPFWLVVAVLSRLRGSAPTPPSPNQ